MAMEKTVMFRIGSIFIATSQENTAMPIGSSILAVLGGLVVASVTMPTSAFAQGCPQWDISGRWVFRQSNGFVVRPGTCAIRNNCNGPWRLLEP